MSEVLKLTVFLSLMSNDNWIQACIATFLISALPAILLIFVPLGILKSKFYGVKFLNVLLSFAAGGLLGDVFIHAIPHLLLDHAHEHAPVDLQDPSLEMEDHHPEDHHHQEHGPHGRMIFIGISVLFGFFLFFIADRIAEYHMFQRVKSQMKKNEDIVATDANISPDSSMDMSTPSKMLTRSAKKAKKEEVGVDAKENSDMVKTIKKNSVVGSFSHMAAAGWLNMMADTMHNFTDGIAIGVAYNSNNPSLAFATTLSVMVHEIPHELGDFAILLSSGLSKYNAIITQLFTATAAFLGTFIGFVVGDILYKSFQDGLLAVTCGGFVYLATCVVLQSVIKDETMHVHGDTDEKSNIVEHNKFISIQQIVGDSLGFMAGVGMMVVVAVMETH